MERTTNILNSYKFISISEKNRLLSENQSKEEVQEILSSFDKDNIEIVKEIISAFRVATEHNIVAANEYLRSFNQNLQWDLGFMLRIISLDYHVLKNTSYSNRKSLLTEIEELVAKYASLSDKANKIEDY